jgi:hypothetical protein
MYFKKTSKYLYWGPKENNRNCEANQPAVFQDAISNIHQRSLPFNKMQAVDGRTAFIYTRVYKRLKLLSC